MAGWDWAAFEPALYESTPAASSIVTARVSQ
jgi:hypothetical protein